MPRIMTMNGDHESVATVPLDLSTTKRGDTGSKTADCNSCGRDARVTAETPASPACTETDSLEIRCPSVVGSQAGAGRKRPADKSPFRLPFRKRPIPVEPETRTQSPAPPERGDRLPSAEDTDIPQQERLRLGRAAEEGSVALLTPSRVEGPGRCIGGFPIPIRFSHQFTHGHCPVLCLHPESTHPVVHPTENLLTSITLATRQDEDGDTPLHIAVVQGEFAIVCKLIRLVLLAGRSLDIYNNLRQTPLHLAVITQQGSMVEALLRAGANPAALDRNGQTALHLCCEYDQQQCLSVVLSLPSSSACLESKNYGGLSPLHLAVLRGQRDLARMLLDAGADINAMDIKSGQSSLMHAVESNNPEMVHFLIENGCDVNSQSYSGNTALHGACGRGQVDTVRLLLKSGADSSLKNYHNDTPVMVAKNKKIADVLRGRGSKHIQGQELHCASVSPHGSNLTENGSPSSNPSRGCSPLTTQLTPHHCSSQSPKTTLVLPFY
ncbi:B-cell lymphoma 3 protein homolog [Aulostomus maculatus]